MNKFSRVMRRLWRRITGKPPLLRYEFQYAVKDAGEAGKYVSVVGEGENYRECFFDAKRQMGEEYDNARYFGRSKNLQTGEESRWRRSDNSVQRRSAHSSRSSKESLQQKPNSIRQ
jgi:hypothetical protein